MSEFQGTASQTLPLEQVELDTEYALVISTNGGLWRYLLGDTITLISLKPHRIKVSGRTAHFINAFGEEVIVTNAEQAITQACSQCGCTVRDFHAAPVFMEGKNSGRHQWIIEFDKAPENLHKFSTLLDQGLQRLNSDYAAKRKGNLILQPLEIIQAHDGLFHTWLKNKGKLGGQNKIPRLSNHRNLIEQFLELQNALNEPNMA